MHNNIFITTEFKDFVSAYIKPNEHVIYSGHNPEHKFLFPLDDNSHKKFFGFVWRAYNEHEKYWFQEQQSTPGVTNTGIMIDIDAYQLGYERNIVAGFMAEVIKIVSEAIYEYINIPEDHKTYCFTLMNEKPYDTGNKNYKEGIHLLFPGIKIKREAKMAIFKKCTEPIQELFINRGFEKDQGIILDKNSSLVPVQIYGTIRKKKVESHKLVYVHTVTFSENCTVTRDETFMKSEHNLALELSIIYPGIAVSKKCFEARESKNIELKSFVFAYSNYLVSDEKRTLAKCKEVKYAHKDGFELHHLLKIIDKRRGAGGNYAEWSKICSAILGVSLYFMPYAYKFSIMCDEESWRKDGASTVLRLYSEVDEVLKTTPAEIINRKSMNTLRGIAKTDNPEGFKLIYKKSLRGKISNLISADKVITDTLVANLIHTFTAHNIYYVNLTSQNSRDGYWYEFIDEMQAVKPEYKPFLYKFYKHTGAVPETLQKFVSETIHDTLQDIYKNAKKELENESAIKIEGEKKGKSKKATNLEHYIQKVEATAKKCGNNMGINSVLNMCKTTHLYNAITFQLDLTQNIIGVGNGILHFSKGCVEFIQERSEYKISRTTDTEYFAYDPGNETIKKVEAILNDIIPDKLKYRALLMHLSQVFVGGSAERYFNILYSGGASGKSILMFLMENALGLISSCKFGAGSGFGYAESIDANVFTSDKKDTGGTDPQLINIEHARFVHCPEGKSGLIRPEIFKKLRDGASMRNLYEKNRSIVFKGIIVMPTNNQLRFMNYNYALERRFLYMYFPSRFVENPKATNEKKMDAGLSNSAKYDKQYGAAFLSILVHHWKMIGDYSSKTEEFAKITKCSPGGNIETDVEKLKKCSVENEKINSLIEKCTVEDALKISGIIEETKNYLASQNYMLQYRSTKVTITKDSKDEIEIAVFCRNYAHWYKQKTGTVMEISPDNFTAEVLDNFADQVIIRNNIQYLSGVRVLED